MLDRRSCLTGAAALWLTGCEQIARAQPRPASAKASALIAAARKQIGVTLSYDPAYTALNYPNGDVPRAKGVCTDVVIRAYRDALSVDLQRGVHEDMLAHFAKYPRRWGLSRADRNIDHRRVPNLEVFLTRKAARLTIPSAAEGWQPGDLFTTLIDRRLPHIGIVSDRISPTGNPLVIHNAGRGAREEDWLLAYPPTGRFRWAL